MMELNHRLRVTPQQHGEGQRVPRVNGISGMEVGESPTGETDMTEQAKGTQQGFQRNGNHCKPVSVLNLFLSQKKER